jgi:hypothetical protein
MLYMNASPKSGRSARRLLRAGNKNRRVTGLETHQGTAFNVSSTPVCL